MSFFNKLFPVILIDNRSEFFNPKVVEYGRIRYTGLRTKVFYCDVGSPYETFNFCYGEEVLK